MRGHGTYQELLGPPRERRLPYPHFQAVLGGLLSPEHDHGLLLSQFREYLEFDDVRYHTMQAASDAVARLTGQHPEVRAGSSWAGGPAV